MKTYTAEELAAILEKHRKWLNGEKGGGRADLRGADLRGADLQEANLQRASLQGASLQGANLYRANLCWANLYRANLCWANLCWANLYGAKMNWQSHNLIAELLRRAAGSYPEKRKVAGLVLISRDWCWENFQKHCGSDPLFAWAIETLRQYVTDGDDAPDILREEAGL